MRKSIPALCLLLVILGLSSCLTFRSHNGKTSYGVTLQSIEAYQKNAVYWNFREISTTTPTRFEDAMSKRNVFPEHTTFFAPYNRTGYVFSLPRYTSGLKSLIRVSETNQEKIVSLYNGVQFVKTEYYDDNTTFEGFKSNPLSGGGETFNEVTSVTSQISSNGIFYSDAKKATASWSLPAPGSAVIVRSSKLHKDAKYLTTIYFHESYPQEERIITFKVPVWLNIEILERNFAGFEIVRSEDQYDVKKMDDPDATNQGQDSKNQKKQVENNDDDEEENQSEDSQDKGQFKYITYTARNLKAIRNENLFPGFSYDFPHLVVLCKSIDTTSLNIKPATTKVKKTKVKSKKKTQKEGDEKEDDKSASSDNNSTIASTADLYKWSYKIACLTDNKVDSLKAMTEEIIKGQQTDIDKVKAIFYWVQDNIRYVAFEDGVAAFKPDACQTVLANKYGDCKGMANLLKWMLVSQGYDARLTWIGTHRLNYDYTIPSLASSNHMICALNLNGKRYFLDGTEKFIGLEDYAHRIQGRPVMIEDSLNYIIDTVPNLAYQRNQHDRTAEFRILENGKISGHVKETLRGENKTSLLNKYHYAETPDRPYVIKQHLKDYDPNIETTNIQYTDLNNREIDQVINYDLTLNYNVIKAENRMFVLPDFIGELTNHDNDTARMSSLAYGHKLYYTHTYSFELPSGYKVASMPQNMEVKTDYYVFKLAYKRSGNKIVYTKELILKTGFVPKKEIKQWNEDVTALKKQYKSYIVLEK